jgi:UDPglucose 6-dehydrogenase
VGNADASFFIPPTPSQPDGSFGNEYLLRALESAAKAVRESGKAYHLFVVNSTLTPGTCDRLLRPLLEDIFQGECGKRFGLCYNPEFIALGDVIHGLLEPDLVLIGESDEFAGRALARVYQRFCLNRAPIERMSNVNAELTKISLNCAVTTKISFVNQLSSVCAEISGADPRTILQAIGKDRRIGEKYLKPGLGFGGPCFPRDNRLFQYVARSVGVEASLAQATDKINDNVNERLLATVLAHAADGATVAVLGLAYKPFTNVLDCSPGVWLCQSLIEHNRKVLAHDYSAGRSASSLLPRIQICNDPQGLVQNGCTTYVIACPWPEYKTFFRKKAQLLGPGTTIIDPWNLLDELSLKNIRYLTNLTSPASTQVRRLAAHM